MHQFQLQVNPVAQPLSSTPSIQHHTSGGSKKRAHKSSGRRQYQSCDKCRGRRRACDAAALGIDPWANGKGDSAKPNSTRSACTSCQKTHSECTFHWLCKLPENALPKCIKNNRSHSLPLAHRDLDYGVSEQRRDKHLGYQSDNPLVTDDSQGMHIWPASQHETSSIQAWWSILPELGMQHLSAASVPPSGDYSWIQEMSPNPQDSQHYGQTSPHFEHLSSPLKTSPNFEHTRWPEVAFTHLESPINQHIPAGFNLPGSHGQKLFEDNPATPYDPQTLLSDCSAEESGVSTSTLPLKVAIEGTAWQDIGVPSVQSSTPSHFSSQVQGGLREGEPDHHSPTSTSMSTSYMPLTPTTTSANADSQRGNPGVNMSELRLARSATRGMISEGLVQIYHNSFENAIECWVSEDNYPYKRLNGIGTNPPVGKTKAGLASRSSLWKTAFQLDAAFKSFRDTQLTAIEEALASRTLKIVVMSFASQWSQYSQYTHSLNTAKHLDGQRSQSPGTDALEALDNPFDFEHVLRSSLWHDARRYVRGSAHLNCFRTILAQLIFFMIEPPVEEVELEELSLWHADKQEARSGGYELAQGTETNSEEHWLKKGPKHNPLVSRPFPGSQEARKSVENAVIQLRNWSRKLGPIFSLPSKGRSRYQGLADALHRVDHQCSSFYRLFWFGLMCDTTSSAMNHRPLVISDDESSYETADTQVRPLSLDEQLHHQATDDPSHKVNVWGLHSLRKLYVNEAMEVTPNLVGVNQADVFLQEAVPVKVMLWRKVAALQSLLEKGNYSPAAIEQQIKEALAVYGHWEDRYGSFLKDCAAHYTAISFKIQSWFTVLAMHWHLSGLILAQCIEAVDMESKSDSLQRSLRLASGLVLEMKRSNSYSIAELARVSNGDLIPNQHNGESSSFHFVFTQGAILTEPCAGVLIEALAKACETFLGWLRHWKELFSDYSSSADMELEWVRCNTNEQELVSFCKDIMRALQMLGLKSDCSRITAAALSDHLLDTSTL